MFKNAITKFWLFANESGTQVEKDSVAYLTDGFPRSKKSIIF
jgi:hypothetical protein